MSRKERYNFMSCDTGKYVLQEDFEQNQTRNNEI